jgi:L-alanine-DL-glutamate epimerase-like enolase superfamily enzyme
MIAARADRFALRAAFTIARGSKTAAEVVTATVTRAGVTGRGEAVPYARYGETVEGVLAAIAALPAGLDHDTLARALPPGAARNAVDCALWDWRAKAAGRRVWELAGLPPPGPVLTAYTLSLDTPAAMGAQAAAHAHRPILKVKLGTPDDLPRLRAVRAGAPAARLIVDANEGWSVADYLALAPALQSLGVEVVEQPLPAGQDAALAGVPRPVPLCADESCHDRASLPRLAGLYDMVNVKLDKTGGLTEALATAAEARRLGLRVMVGCMVGTSLAMAPAVLVAQGAALADLDGPLLLAEDRPHPLAYDARGVHPPEAQLWG